MSFRSSSAEQLQSHTTAALSPTHRVSASAEGGGRGGGWGRERPRGDIHFSRYTVIPPLGEQWPEAAESEPPAPAGGKSVVKYKALPQQRTLQRKRLHQRRTIPATLPPAPTIYPSYPYLPPPPPPPPPPLPTLYQVLPYPSPPLSLTPALQYYGAPPYAQYPLAHYGQYPALYGNPLLVPHQEPEPADLDQETEHPDSSDHTVYWREDVFPVIRELELWQCACEGVCDAMVEGCLPDLVREAVNSAITDIIQSYLQKSESKTRSRQQHPHPLTSTPSHHTSTPSHHTSIPITFPTHLHSLGKDSDLPDRLAESVLNEMMLSLLLECVLDGGTTMRVRTHTLHTLNGLLFDGLLNILLHKQSNNRK